LPFALISSIAMPPPSPFAVCGVLPPYQFLLASTFEILHGWHRVSVFVFSSFPPNARVVPTKQSFLRPLPMFIHALEGPLAVSLFRCFHPCPGLQGKRVSGGPAVPNRLLTVLTVDRFSFFRRNQTRSHPQSDSVF